MDKRGTYKNKPQVKNIEQADTKEDQGSKGRLDGPEMFDIEELKQKHGHFTIYRIVKEITGQ